MWTWLWLWWFRWVGFAPMAPAAGLMLGAAEVTLRVMWRLWLVGRLPSPDCLNHVESIAPPLCIALRR